MTIPLARFASVLVLGWALLVATGTAYADVVPTLKDAVSQGRAIRLEEQLRCLVCQNQTIADSNAELAQDLRRQVREMITAGKSDDDIIAYMTARYGDFVLYRPPLKATTVLLWAAPAILVGIGLLVMVRVLRTRRLAAPPPELSAEEHERALKLLGREAGDKPGDRR